MQWFTQAPSNIALIKYMGKKEEGVNIPNNPSLSYTLNNLLSSVMLETYHGKKDIWEPLNTPGTEPFSLSTDQQQRFLSHLARVKARFFNRETFIVRSTNNFPQSSGLASSASSFAALTKCAVTALCELTEQPLLSVEEQAELSREGSGSSCRSFFSPWALWHEDKVEAIQFPYNQLIHQVLIISQSQKTISSSEAHQRVKTSRYYDSRAHRATMNLTLLRTALDDQNWPNAYEICWREFQDMHQLFATSNIPFSYITTRTQEALDCLQDLWHKNGDGPLVTMDAGPNIHLLYRPDQMDLALQYKKDHWIGNYDVL